MKFLKLTAVMGMLLSQNGFSAVEDTCTVNAVRRLNVSNGVQLSVRCTRSNLYWVQVTTGSEAAMTQLATIGTAALISQKQVRLQFDQTKTECDPTGCGIRSYEAIELFAN